MIIEEMTPDECFELLQQIGFGRLGCARSSQPYVVPIYFAADKDHIYGFSTLGKKIEWMRANPLVCVEVDEIISHAQWRSVVAVLIVCCKSVPIGGSRVTSYPHIVESRTQPSQSFIE